MTEIVVTAWNGPAQVGGVRIPIALDTAIDHAAGESSTAEMEMRRPSSHEFTLEIIYEPSLGRYRFQLRGSEIGILPPSYSATLVGAHRRPFRSVLEGLNTQARNLNGLTKSEQARWLRGLGTVLANNLVPKRSAESALGDQRLDRKIQYPRGWRSDALGTSLHLGSGRTGGCFLSDLAG